MESLNLSRVAVLGVKERENIHRESSYHSTEIIGRCGGQSGVAWHGQNAGKDVWEREVRG
jgi:hypothetical protein